MKLSGTGVEGIGFAIPISSTTEVVSQLIEYKKVIRPYIGIAGTAIDASLAEKFHLVEGVYVSEVEDFSAAQKAGIKVGDTIVEVEGSKIATVDDINEIKNQHSIGDVIKIKLYRDNDYITINLTLEEEP